MGVYVFSPDALRRWLTADPARLRPRRHPGDARPAGGVFGHRFDGYWRDVGTVEAYWKANLDLVGLVPPLDLFDRSWLIHTRSEERSPAKIGPDAVFRHSLVSHGCIINGTVLNSVLSPGVSVYEGAVVRDSVILLDTEIGAGAVVDTAIIDKFVHGRRGRDRGPGDDRWIANVDEPERLTTGITVVGKRAVIPAGDATRPQRPGRHGHHRGGLRVSRRPLRGHGASPGGGRGARRARSRSAAARR